MGYVYTIRWLLHFFDSTGPFSPQKIGSFHHLKLMLHQEVKLKQRQARDAQNNLHALAQQELEIAPILKQPIKENLWSFRLYFSNGGEIQKLPKS